MPALPAPDLHASLYGNPLSDWLVALGIALALNLAFAIVRRVVMATLRRSAPSSPATWDDVLVHVLEKTYHALLFLATLWVGSRWLVLPDKAQSGLRFLATLGFVLQVGVWLSSLLGCLLVRYEHKARRARVTPGQHLVVLNLLGKTLIWSAALLLLLVNTGIDVTTLLAGLGVGGVAIALAVQNVLGDLFASLSIVLDKPFVIGDYIVVDQHEGSVERIGIKSTHIRGVGGEQIIVANSDLLSSRVRNLQRMPERRISFRIGVSYDTPPSRLERIPALFREILERQPETRHERSHLAQLSEASIEFEFVYWVLSPSFARYMDVQQAINLALLRALAVAGVALARPAQLAYVAPMSSAAR